MLGGSGLPRGVRGCPFSLLQRRNRNQTPPVPQSAARARDMLIHSSNATLKLSGSVTWIHQGIDYNGIIQNSSQFAPSVVSWYTI